MVNNVQLTTGAVFFALKARMHCMSGGETRLLFGTAWLRVRHQTFLPRRGGYCRSSLCRCKTCAQALCGIGVIPRVW